eukprot:gene10951-13415_t
MDIDSEKKRKREFHDSNGTSNAYDIENDKKLKSSSINNRDSRDYRDSRGNDIRDRDYRDSGRYRDDRDRRYSGGGSGGGDRYRDNRYYDERDNRDLRRNDRDYDNRDRDYYYRDRDQREREQRDLRDRERSSNINKDNVPQQQHSITSSNGSHQPQQQQQQHHQQKQQQTSPPLTSSPPQIQQQQPVIDPEVLKKQKEEEKKREQEKLDEEMRKRREKVEQWRKQKELKEQQEKELKEQQKSNEDEKDEKDLSNSNMVIKSIAEISASKNTNLTSPPTSKILPPSLLSKSSLFNSSGNSNNPQLSKLSSPFQQQQQQQQQKKQEDEDDDVDPFEAFMNNLEQEQQKGSSNNTASSANNKQIRMINGEEEGEGEFESEDEDNEDKEKEVKKGKRELLATDHTKIDYQPFEKNFYVEVPVLANMTETEVLDCRSDLGIKITGKNCPKPVQSWTQCGLSEKIHILLKKYSYEKPTPIQAQTIPAIMNGRDIIGIARTGSGKTLAFLLPMFRHVLAQQKSAPGEGMIGLIMSPTRELALQIYSECKKFSKPLGLRVSCIYGGASISEQIADLKRGSDIVVCTPGRMIDILCANNKRITNLRRVTFLVLDEADRMFDMGFGPQIMCVVENIRPDRQTIMFSATFPPKVENAARKILTRPLEIIAGGRSIVCSDVEQIVEVRPDETRFRRLMELLSTWYHKGQILIFTNRQETTDNLFRQLATSGYQCLSLHGSKDQTDRDETISDFKNKVKTILIATPLASRGLDVKDLNLVVNFDCPDHLEDYVHRVGRTGRAGNKGTAYTFITPDEERYAPSIIKALEQSNTKVPDELARLGKEYLKKKLEGKEVLVAPTGFTGRGHKFDAAEEDKKKKERKAQRKAYGIEDEDDESEQVVEDDLKSPIAGITSPTTANTASPTTANTASPTTPTTTSTTNTTTTATTPTTPTTTTNTTPPTGLLQTDPSLPVHLQAISQVLGGNVTTSQEDAIKAIQMAALAKVPKQTPASTTPTTPAATNTSTTNATTSPIHGHFHDEIEINDYSQAARWKVTHKDALLSITDFTSTVITTKGTFFGPGKTPGPGERKLYLYIEGSSESGVKSAKVEIKKILDEVQAYDKTGKYSVF